MKTKIILAMCLMLGAAFAADKLGMRKGSYGMAGCGLGSMVFEENSAFNQVLAATTNGTFGSQTFGISTGTSNCADNGVAKVEKQKEMFVAMNYEKLTQEMAQGRGETLVAYSSVLGCKQNADKFSNFAKKNYKDKFSKAKNAQELSDLVDSQIASDVELSKNCNQ